MLTFSCIFNDFVREKAELTCYRANAQLTGLILVGRSKALRI